MKLNSAQLEAFVQVAQSLNFTKAAEVLNLTQSALSQRVSKLEDEIETTLFIRDRNSVKLTEAGFKLLQHCQLLDAAENGLLTGLRSSKQGFAGTVRIAGFSSINRSLVIPSLKRIMHSNPNLSIQLVTREIRDLNDLLRRAEADYVLTSREPSTTDIESIFLGLEENVLVSSKRYQTSEIYLDHDERDVTTKSYFKQNKVSRHPMKMRYLDDVYGLIDGVKNGYGKAVLPRHLIECEKDLVILDEKKILKVPVYLQFFKQPYYRPTHAPLLDSLTSHFKEKLSN